MDLTNKVALITGGTLGIGAAIAVNLAQRGAHIAVVARNCDEQSSAVKQAVTAAGRRFFAHAADIALPEHCQRAVDVTVQEFGRLDVLIHNAGGPSPGKIDEVSPEQWHYTMNVHVNANYYLARAALPHMRKQKEGAIIMVSSSAGLRGVPGAVAYATAKGALPQFARALARDLADDNIRVNCVAPGVIRTRFHADMSPERKRLNLDQRIPLHREGTPEQVAEVVAMLVTNDYITGETISIDGGLTMRIV